MRVRAGADPARTRCGAVFVADFDQSTRRIAISTPLGENALALTRFSGVERLSQPFAFSLGMISEDRSIDPRELVGGNVTVTIQAADGKPVYFNGDIIEFGYEGSDDRSAHYAAVMVPRMRFLRLRADCRIFQDMSVPDVIERVLRDGGVSDLDLSDLIGSYARMEYCVQYRETDFDFISRLMEREGISYRFRHEDGRHVLCLGDHVGAYMEADRRVLRLRSVATGIEAVDEVRDWNQVHAAMPGGVDLSDFDFRRPGSSVIGSRSSTLGPADLRGNRLFEYPSGRFDGDAGSALARIRMEQIESAHGVASGASGCEFLSPGLRFSLESDGRSAGGETDWLLVSVRHHVSETGYVTGAQASQPYSNEFTCVPSDMTWRPPRVTPPAVVHGPQTAIVVGPEGEEIHVDEFGRVKVRFHWDRSSTPGSRSSCWIRVSQGLAGRGWGGIFLPRIGQEVVVEFLEGDPDRPIITGCVYNGMNRPPYELPTNKTLSGFKSNSTVGGKGFNELRFDDTTGEEQVFLHAQRNLDVRVLNDRFETVKGDRHSSAEGSRRDRTGVDRHIEIARDEVMSIGRDHHVSVKGKRAVEITGSSSLRVNGEVVQVFGGAVSTDVAGGSYLRASGIVIEAESGITLKCGSSAVVIDPSGVTLKGASLTLDGASVRIASGPGSPAAAGRAGRCVKPMSALSPDDADEADVGLVASTKAREKQDQAGKYGSTPAATFRKREGDESESEDASWVEIELLDDSGEPIAGERFEITLPDEQGVYSGTTDGDGIARVEGFKPGECRVTFPSLDQKAWKLE